MNLNSHSTGSVAVVGAGPGAIDLMTVRGQKRLAQADVVFYTGSLVPEAMLDLCHADAIQIDTRTHTLETWVPLLLEHVQARKQVVRLQDVDPCLYGALSELIVVLMKHQIPFEVVPGVSAFQAAAAQLQVELTVPNLVQSIILTRIQGETDVPPAEDLAAMAAHGASLCLYLSAHHCHQAQAKLLQHYPEDTSVAICYAIGWPDESIELVRWIA